MNKYWKYVLFPVFLDDIKDCTFVNMEDADLTSVLNNITKLALQDFLFPKVSLAYEEDTTYDSLDSEEYGYYFVDDNVGDAEYKVVLAYMKVHWVESQITWDANFRNPIFDSSLKGFSPANMLTAMKNMQETLLKRADSIRFNYNRTNKDGKIRWGQINAKKS